LDLPCGFFGGIARDEARGPAETLSGGGVACAADRPDERDGEPELQGETRRVNFAKNVPNRVGWQVSARTSDEGRHCSPRFDGELDDRVTAQLAYLARELRSAFDEPEELAIELGHFESELFRGAFFVAHAWSG
jgi:hypothetical protein